MAKRKSSKLDKQLEVISTLKSAAIDWPKGYKNGRIRDLLENEERVAQNELFELLNQSKITKERGNKEGMGDSIKD